MNDYDTAGRAKTRHYQKLASELQKLSDGVCETKTLFAKLEGDLTSMRTLAGLHAAQFMAFTNMEDAVVLVPEDTQKHMNAQDDLGPPPNAPGVCVNHPATRHPGERRAVSQITAR